jgi:hypothetical protein
MYNLVEKIKERQTEMEQGLCIFEFSSKKIEHSSLNKVIIKTLEIFVYYYFC